jgi:hypothetical protein
MELNKDMMHSLKNMVDKQNTTDEKINLMCFKLDGITNKQNEQMFVLTQQMSMMRETILSNLKIINEQSQKILKFEERLSQLEVGKVNKTEAPPTGLGKINKGEINDSIEEINKESMKKKEKQMYEKFVKYQEENTQYNKLEWNDGNSIRKIIPNKNNNKEKKRSNYIEIKTKITKEMNSEIAGRIMAGKSPYELEKVKILYFEGFKKNRIGYTRAVLCQSGIPNDAILSISYIGLSILEVIVKQSYINKMIEIGIGLKGIWLKDFNPLKIYKEIILPEKNGEQMTPRQAFESRLNKIIEQGRGPIKLIKIIKNCTMENITRFLMCEVVQQEITMTENSLMSQGNNPNVTQR